MVVPAFGNGGGRTLHGRHYQARPIRAGLGVGVPPCGTSPYVLSKSVPNLSDGFPVPVIAGNVQDGYVEDRVVGPKSFGIEP